MRVTAVEVEGDEAVVTRPEPAASRSYLRNCVLIPRKGERLFEQTVGGAVLARLDGYVVLPTEQYQALLTRP
ncbi:MAG: hypothetical protein IRY94_03520 [Rhodospirillaceae bacterium]|nr:hypothetical protein [Rhodospirillaceae bacterium]